MEQREIDNMLLSMIQKHFPSLPLSDEHTDWGKWLGFARAVYEAGRASPASVPEGYALVPVEPTDEMCGAAYNDRMVWNGGPRAIYEAMLAAAPTPPVQGDGKDADLWRDLVYHQKFNNVPAVGYAINRAKERQAAMEGSDERRHRRLYKL